MASRKGNTQATSDITHGLAQMENHWRAEDGQIEECSSELWDSWPVQEALKEFHNDPEATLAILAGRMFLAGSESSLSLPLPCRSVSAALPIADPDTPNAAAISSLARAIYEVPQGEASHAARLADQLLQIAPEIPSTTLSVLKQLVLSILALKRERLAVELEQNTERSSEQIPQDVIDREVEDILRLSQEDEEEGAA